MSKHVRILGRDERIAVGDWVTLQEHERSQEADLSVFDPNQHCTAYGWVKIASAGHHGHNMLVNQTKWLVAREVKSCLLEVPFAQWHYQNQPHPLGQTAIMLGARPTNPFAQQEAQREADLWRSRTMDLLARIHRDGGLYVTEHGIEKAITDAHTKMSKLQMDEEHTFLTKKELEDARIEAMQRWNRSETELSKAKAEILLLKQRFLDMNKDLGCELRDPNGTIWEHTAKVQKENEELMKNRGAYAAYALQLRNAVLMLSQPCTCPHSVDVFGHNNECPSHIRSAALALKVDTKEKDAPVK